jgi:ribosomal protein S18 acetylase RimI-like enzyme
MRVTSQLRSVTNADSAFIVEMARHACVIEDWPLPEADSEDVQDLLPSSSDITIVATDTTGISIGAVWTFHHYPPLLLSSDGDALPEITIAVTPGLRGNGVGSALLDELIARSMGRYEALSLNVHQRNPASRLRIDFRQFVGDGASKVAG